jgi:hypothetical protein
MNTQPAQPISHNGQQAITPINTARLADIAELLDILDGFLRHADDIADRLADYLHTTGRDHPNPRSDHHHHRLSITVRLDRRAYSPVLRQADLPNDTPIPWWNNRTLRYEFT